jgi:hypothetical protein
VTDALNVIGLIFVALFDRQTWVAALLAFFLGLREWNELAI